MAPHPSESEGEIVDSETDKATTAQPESSNTSVNRKLRDATRSPSPIRSESSSKSGSRDRSRSPRGEKRHWDDRESRRHVDRYSGSRQFNQKYQPHNRTDRSRRFAHYRTVTARLDSQTGSDRPRDSKRPRNRSRSPNRHQPSGSRHRGGADRDHKDEHRRNRGFDSREGDNGRLRDRPSEQSVTDVATSSKANKANLQREAKPHTATSIDGRNVSKEETHGNDPHGDMPRNADQDLTTIKLNVEPPEELSMEERRKRREAIKAKYKSQQAPLLAQALQVDTTPTSTPSVSEAKSPASERALSTQPDSPYLQQVDSAPGSPPSLAVSDDADLARSTLPEERQDNVAEPSAADYDPSMDMQEDKVRQTQRAHGLPENTQSNQQPSADVPQPSIEPEQAQTSDELSSKKKKSASDDMFASDDDEDMFAPVTASNRPDSRDQSQSLVHTNKAKQLDMSLLDNWDDPDGYYRIILEELLDGRYQVQANLGRGMFSSVVRAMDNKSDRLVAIKIIRNNESMIKAGTKEMEILQQLADADPDDKKHLIRLHRSFSHKGHLCMVFENLSINLREVLKKFGRDVGINLKAVRSYAQQMFLGLSLLRKCNILHADLKPDNMLVNENRNMLKICDLGSAADSSESDITPYLVSRFYRAPEIILGIPYDFAIDMWSVGCTLFELYTGKILFTGRTNNQMLKSIMECRGKFSLKMLKKAEFGAVHFDDQNLHFRSVERDKVTGRDVTRLINFVKPTRDLKTRLMAAAGTGLQPGAKTLPEAELKELNLFADLLDRCLALNPEKRMTPTDALKHPFIFRAAGSATK